MIRLIVYLFKMSGRTLVISTLLSLLAAAGNVSLMGLTVNAFRATSSHTYAKFWLLCAVLLCSRTIAEIGMIRLMHENIRQLRIRLSRQVAAMTQKSIETIGQAPILYALTEDINAVINVGTSFPNLAMSLCITLGILGYLLYLSLLVFGLVTLTILIVVASYKILTAGAFPFFMRARDASEAGITDVTTLLGGSKELRLDAAKHERTLAELESHSTIASREGFKALRRFSLGGSWVSTAYFLLLGALITLPQTGRFGLPRSTALAAVLSVLFLKGAVESVFGVFPMLGRAGIALGHIKEVGLKLEAAAEVSTSVSLEEAKNFENIRLKEVMYLYEAVNRQTPFCLGPVSLHVSRGELLFLAGGNGAGKTSLLKVLCGLYKPTQGSVQLDDRTLTPEEAGNYRQIFSAVFQDFYLLKKTSQLARPEIREKAEQYLTEFGLEGVVTLKEDEFACGELSRGQQKRLALLIALVENKPVCILDEWAADQDPHFKTYFYSTILPRMKKEGRTVIAVTHDDIYYHVADRVVLLRDGIVATREVPRTGAANGCGDERLALPEQAAVSGHP